LPTSRSCATLLLVKEIASRMLTPQQDEILAVRFGTGIRVS
jgi:hypothetical protein